MAQEHRDLLQIEPNIQQVYVNANSCSPNRDFGIANHARTL